MGNIDYSKKDKKGSLVFKSSISAVYMFKLSVIISIKSERNPFKMLNSDGCVNMTHLSTAAVYPLHFIILFNKDTYVLYVGKDWENSWQ